MEATPLCRLPQAAESLVRCERQDRYAKDDSSSICQYRFNDRGAAVQRSRIRKGRNVTGLIVHEWAAQSGGSEKVLEQFVRLFPNSDLQVLWNDTPGRYDVPTYESWLARTPLRRHKALALPLLPLTWRMIPPRRAYEWMLVSSHLFAHHARVQHSSDSVPKFVYAHTPARYLWEPKLDQRGNTSIARGVSAALKPLDRHRAQEAHKIAANSRFTADRIARAWNRDADVIYPPVDTHRLTALENLYESLAGAEAATFEALPDEFLLGASRFVSYKRLELVIDAGEACELPVVLAGGGPDRSKLARRAQNASVPVTIINAPSDNLLYALMQSAVAYIFPAVEDFGIMPVEAMSLGTPAIVPQQGGASESVTLVKGGAILSENTREGWRTAIDEACQVDRAGLRDRVRRFSNERFRAEISAWMGVPAID